MSDLVFVASIKRNTVAYYGGSPPFPIIHVVINGPTPADEGIWISVVLKDMWGTALGSAVYNAEESECKCSGYAPRSGPAAGMGSRCHSWIVPGDEEYAEPWCYVKNEGTCAYGAEKSWYYTNTYYRNCDLAVKKSVGWMMQPTDFYPTVATPVHGSYTLIITGTDIIGRQASVTEFFTVTSAVDYGLAYVVISLKLTGACGVDTGSLTAALQTTVVQFVSLPSAYEPSLVRVTSDYQSCSSSRRINGYVTSKVHIPNLSDSQQLTIHDLFTEMLSDSESVDASSLRATFLSSLISAGNDATFAAISSIEVSSVTQGTWEKDSALEWWAILLIVIACLIAFTILVFLGYKAYSHYGKKLNRNYVAKDRQATVSYEEDDVRVMTYQTADGKYVSEDSGMSVSSVIPSMGDDLSKLEKTSPPAKQPAPVDHLVQI